MKKKIFAICALALVIVLALFAFTACNTAKSNVGEELVDNGDFQTFDKDTGKFEGWTTSSSSVNFKSGHPSDDLDNYHLIIDNTSKMYSYLYQQISVDVNKIYKVSVDIRINNSISNDYGAYVAFLENVEYKFAQHKKATNGFVTEVFYVQPKNTDYLTLALCVGAEDQTTTGRALFDNVSVTRVNKTDVPAGAEIVKFRKAKTVVSSESISGTAFVVCLTLLTVALLVAAYILVRRLYSSRNGLVNFGEKTLPYANAKDSSAGVQYSVSSAGKKWYQHPAFIASCIALGAFIIRLIIIVTTYGMGAEMKNTIALADTLSATNGVRNYYALHSTATVSPGTMYILAIIGAMSKNLNYQSTSMLLRFINAFADVAIVLMIFFYGSKRSGNKLATIYSTLYAVLPFAFVLAGFGKGFESVLVALMLASVLLMLEKQYLATYFVMTLATVLDVRALAIAPVIMAYFVYMYIKDEKSLKKFTKNRIMIIAGLVGAFVLSYLLTLPVAINQIAAGKPFFGWTALANEVINNQLFVYNAFNLYGMVSMNGRMLSNSVSVLNLIFLLVLEAYVISLYFKNRNKQELILIIAFTLASISVFTVKVDYTYLFLSLAFMLIYAMVSGEKRMFLIMSGYAFLGFLDIGQMLNQSGFITKYTEAAITSYETLSPFYILFSVLIVILSGYFVYVVYSITNNSKRVDIKAMPMPFFKTVKKYFDDLKFRLSRKDEA